MNITTWNMQGSNAATEVKWQTGVLSFFGPKSDSGLKPDILCLQESGQVPESSKLIKELTIYAPDKSPHKIQLFQYGGTAKRSGFTIAFHEWDENGGRVNTAIVFPDSPPADDHFALVWPAGGPTWRPALGMKTSHGWLFSFHAISPNGPDGAEMLKAIVTTVGKDPWIAAGDWNREPKNLSIPSGSCICPPNSATHPTSDPKSQYDYLVRSGTSAVKGTVTSLIMSDHRPVAYVL